MGARKIVESSKATMVLVIFLTLAALVASGKLEQEYLKKFLEIIMPTWLLAHAGEQGAKAMAARPSNGSFGTWAGDSAEKQA